MSGECQVNVKSQSELDIGGRETCPLLISLINHQKWLIDVRYGKVKEGRPTFFLDFMYR